MTLRALSLTQPWASLVALGRKKIETRNWSTAHRGWIAIHASKGFPPEARDLAVGTPFIDAFIQTGVYDSTDDLPLGAIVAVANLYHVGKIARNREGAVYIDPKDWAVTDAYELAFGDYTPGRYGWVLTNVGRLREPIPCKGALGLWTVPPDVEAAIRKQVPV